MARAIPFASLLVQAVPLGVLGYLYAAGKRGENGTTPMAESGVRAELIQALKAEYAAFAEADRAAITKALADEMTTWKTDLPAPEPSPPPVEVEAPEKAPAEAPEKAPAEAPVEDAAKPRPSFFSYFRRNAREDADKKPPSADAEDGEDHTEIKAASTVDTISKEDAIKQFKEILEYAGMDKQGNTKELLSVIKKHPSIVAEPFDGQSVLQLVVAAAIADAEGTPPNPGFFRRLGNGVGAALAPAVSAVGKVGQIAAAAAVAANENLNPVAIAKRRAREAEVLNDIYEPPPPDDEGVDEDAMEGGATMNEWAAVVTQILRTPYVYEDTSLEDAVTALNERIKKEAKYKTARKKELAAQARSPKVVLTKKKTDAEFELSKARDTLTAADDEESKAAAQIEVEVAKARLSDASKALLEAEEDTETFNASAESDIKEAAAEDAVEARELLLAAKERAFISRRATPRPVAAFNDLIAMRGVKPENRKQTAKSLVPVLKAFMWWRWNVIHYPLSYTTEQVVDAQHLLDGMTARTQPIAPFFNASVTLRRNINEKRGLKPSPEEVEAAAAEAAALKTALAATAEADRQIAERKAADAKEEAEKKEKERIEEEAEAARVRIAAENAAMGTASPPEGEMMRGMDNPMRARSLEKQAAPAVPPPSPGRRMSEILPPVTRPAVLPLAATPPVAQEQGVIMSPDPNELRVEKQPDFDAGAITLTINGAPVKLSIGDCITFARTGKDDDTITTTAKITGFTNSSIGITGITYIPWRDKERRWGSDTFPARIIGLAEERLRQKTGENWQTIKKLPACPIPASPPGGTPVSSPIAAQPDVLPNSIAAAAPEDVGSEQASGGSCEAKPYTDSRRKLIAALSQRNLKGIKENWQRLLEACGDSTPPPESVKAFNNATTDAEKAQVIANVIATLLKDGAITPEKAAELRAVPATGGKRRRTSRRSRKGRRVRKTRNSTFRRHRKH